MRVLDRKASSQSVIGTCTNLAPELLGISKVLAVFYTPRELLIVLDESCNARDVRQVEMTRPDNYRIKGFLPPVVCRLTRHHLPERQDPVVALLLRQLDRGTELDQLIMASTCEDCLNPFSNDLAVSERRARSILGNRAVREYLGDRLLREGHDLGRDIAVECFMHAAIRISQLVRFDLLGLRSPCGKALGEVDGRIGALLDEVAERRDPWRKLRSVNPKIGVSD